LLGRLDLLPRKPRGDDDDEEGEREDMSDPETRQPSSAIQSVPAPARAHSPIRSRTIAMHNRDTMHAVPRPKDAVRPLSRRRRFIALRHHCGPPARTLS